MPERDRRILQALVFRDLWFVLELYKTYLQQIANVAPALPTATPTARKPLDFGEFLFDL